MARDVLDLSRNQLLVNLRFLDAALSRFVRAEIKGIPLATDGRSLVYDPIHIIRCYQDDRTVPVRDYLHVVLHCVFRHMFVHTLVSHTTWDLACDIAVEYTITGLGLKAAAAAREAKQQAVYQELKREIGQLTAEKIYRHYLDVQLSAARKAELRDLFRADDHSIWYMSDEEKAALGLADAGGSGNAQGEASGGQSGDEYVIGSESDWQSVSERIQMDMETFSKGQGRDPGAMLQNLREVNRERYDYTMDRHE